MTPPSKSRSDRPAYYQIVVRGELSDRFAHAFPEMTLQPEAGYTRIIVSSRTSDSCVASCTTFAVPLVGGRRGGGSG